MKEPFYVLAYEAGVLNTPVEVFASKIDNPLAFNEKASTLIQKHKVSKVPSAFQLLSVLSNDECNSLIKMAESLGYVEDSSISLPRSVRHNDNLVYIIDDTLEAILWKRCEVFMQDTTLYKGKKAVALNKRFRFYKYKEGDYFKEHTDGAWPGSSVINEKLVHNAYKDRYSQMTFLFFLNDMYEGGATEFLVDNNKIAVKTPKGGVLCFAHGNHPLHSIHSSQKISKGVKYVVRTDVLFEV